MHELHSQSVEETDSKHDSDSVHVPNLCFTKVDGTQNLGDEACTARGGKIHLPCFLHPIFLKSPDRVSHTEKKREAKYRDMSRG